MDILTLAQNQFGELTELEARSLTDEIKAQAEVLWSSLTVAHDRKAHKALGYETWGDYVAAEFNMSRRRSYQLLDQARVIHAIGEASDLCTDVHISEAEARDIKPVLEVVTNRIRERIETSPAITPERRAEIVQEVASEVRQEQLAKRNAYEEAAADAKSLGLREDASAAAEDRRVATMWPLYRALETISRMPNANEAATQIKDHERAFVEAVPAAIAWLQRFAEAAA